MNKLKALLIAEKPDARKDMESAYKLLPSDYPYEIDFTNAYGHLVGLLEPDGYGEEWSNRNDASILPMLPKKWKFRVLNKQFNTIKDLITNGDYDFIINGCDPEREGFLIFDNIYKKAGCTLEVKRLWFDDQTPETLKEAFCNLRDYDDYVGYRCSSLYRTLLDWLIGMNFSRAASISTQSSFIIGRCITVILAMIVSLEREIENFVPQDYFECVAKFTTKDSQSYLGLLINPSNIENKHRFLKMDEIKKADFENGPFEVTQVKDEEQQIRPKTLYNLKDLQTACASLYGYSPKKTLDIAQSLYEKHKVLSYPRTDCRFLTDGIAARFREHLSAMTGISTLEPYCTAVLNEPTTISRVANDKNYVNNKKISDHPALIPTHKPVDPGKLTSDELNVYTLVAKRFLALFLPNCVYSKRTILTTCRDYHFLSSGKTLLKKGWKELYPVTEKDTLLPSLTEHEVVSCNEFDIQKKETKPPTRYTDGSLLTAMENAGSKVDEKDLATALKKKGGIGTSATRADLIEKIISYHWVDRVKKGKTSYLSPTPKGCAMIDTLQGQIIISPEFTASWEQRFLDIEHNNKDDSTLYRQMIDYISQTTSTLLSDLKPNDALKDVKKSVGICPTCGSPVVIGKSAYICESFFKKNEAGEPSCTFGLKKVICGANLSEKDIATLLTTGYTPKKMFTWASKKKSESKLMLVDEDQALDIPTGIPKFSVKFAPFETTYVGSCPLCNNQIISYNKVFSCENKECGFHLFKKCYSATISDADARKIIRGEKVQKNFISKKGLKYPALVMMKSDFSGYETEYIKKEKRS